jgi:uncharacterized protein YuzE
MVENFSMRNLPMTVTYDSEADAVYIYLKHPIGKGEVDHGAACEGAPMQLDFDAAGKILGIEVLLAAEVLPEEFLNRMRE